MRRIRGVSRKSYSNPNWDNQYYRIRRVCGKFPQENTQMISSTQLCRGLCAAFFRGAEYFLLGSVTGMQPALYADAPQSFQVPSR